MKKLNSILFISICLFFALPFFALSVTVFAENQFQATIISDCSAETPKTVNRGMPIDIPIRIENNQGLSGLMLTVSYNNTNDNIKFIGYTKNEEITNFSLMPSGKVLTNGSTSYFNFVFYTNDVFKTQNTLLVTCHFISSISAPVGNYDITISYDEHNTHCNNKDVAVEITSPVVHLTNGKFTAEWRDWDNHLIKSQEFNGIEGEVLAPPTNPTRDADECYEYDFAQWSNPISVDEKTIVYTAEYNKTPIEYSVFYYVDGYNTANPETANPDGEITTNDFYTALPCYYGEIPELKNFPIINNYTFFGWFTDENFTNKFTGTMPSEDLNLYGYMKYNIREDEYPKIQLKHISTNEQNIAKVAVTVVENPGYNSIKLTLDETTYNTTFFSFIKCDFNNFTPSGNIDSQGNVTGNGPYSFLWESTTENTYATGEILTLYFQINNNTPNGAYPITLTYNETADVTYFKDGTMWYSMLEIVEAKVPVGTKTDFEAQVANTSIILKAKSNKEIAYNVEMVIEDVTSKMIDQLGAEKINKAIGDNRKVSKIYSIYFTQNGELFEPNATMTYTLQLTEEQKLAVDLTLFKVNNDQISNYNSALQNDNIKFTSDVIAEWLIAEDIASIGAGFAGSISVQAMLMIIMLCSDVLAGALIVLAKNFKSKKHKIQGGIE